MKALVIKAPGKAEIIETEKPSAGPDDVVSRVSYSGICGTDLAIFSGDMGLVREGLIKYPVRIGHEWAGVVCEVGENVAGFRPGDRVVSDTAVTCGRCAHCLAGEYNLCANVRSLGTINCWDGSFAEYIVLPQRHMHKLPDSVALDDAALVEPASIALCGVKGGGVRRGKTVLVVGTGAIGISAAALSKYFGASKVIVSGRKRYKLDVAEKAGADETVNAAAESVPDFVMKHTGGKGADVVIETSGNIDTLPDCLDAAGKNAAVSLLGFYEKPLDNFNIDRLVAKELVVRGIMGKFGTAQEVVDILATGKINLHPLITHRYPFSEVIEAIKTANEKNATKIKMLVKIS